MVEQRGLATSPVSSGGTPARENGSKLGMPPYPCSTVAKEVTPR